MGEHANLYMGKDIYFWNFIVLMVFTLFELGAVFFETVPGTDIGISRSAVWAILIGVGIVKGYGIAAFFMHLRDEHKCDRTAKLVHTRLVLCNGTII